MIPNAIFILINLVCITVSAFVAVQGFFGSLTDLLVEKPIAAQQSVYRVGDADKTRKPLSAYKAVLDRNLFDTRSTAAPTAKKVDVESLEETKLNLKLWGTVSGVNQGDYAVIEDVKARQQNLYRTGDAIQTATVKKIFREKVVLTVNGKDEILQMQELKSGKGVRRPGGPTSQATGASGNKNIRAQRISLRRSYIEKSLGDMASLMTQVQIRPHMEEGVASGLALSNIKPNSIFRRMGLRNGDIITGVDGREISSVDDALGLVDNLQSAANVSVQLKRRGREKNIEYRIK